MALTTLEPVILEERQTLTCPSCGCRKVYKAGKFVDKSGAATQRLKCAECGKKFSEKYNRCLRQVNPAHYAQIEVSEKMDAITEPKTVIGDPKLNEYHIQMKIDGYKPATIKLSWSTLEILLKKGADLEKPESVKKVISEQTWGGNRKRNVINAYTKYLKYVGLTWEPPNNTVTRKLPFIPTTQEVDELISGCTVPVATFLQLLFETAMRSGEAIQLQWTDIDFNRRVIYCNNPEKGSDARIFDRISGKLLSMLNALPHVNSYVFGEATSDSLKATFSRSRKRLSFKLQNPRLNLIHFHSMRHMRATLEYHRTKDLLHVAQFLGHREVKNTMLYIQLDKQLFANYDGDQFLTKIAANTEEACKLIDVGFEYVTGEYNDGGKIFRKRK